MTIVTLVSGCGNAYPETALATAAGRESERRATHHVAEWRGSWPFVPELLHDWDVDELAESINEKIPAQAWQDLVIAWLQVT
jgi:hypothetical protein